MSERLTDEELARLGTRTESEPEAELVERAFAELRRLRSDEWLEKAIREFAAEFRADGATGLDAGRLARLLAILKRHRDGA